MKAQIKVILILLTVVVAALAYAMSPLQFSLGEYNLKKISLLQLKKASAHHAAPLKKKLAKKQAEPSKAEEAPVDSSHHVILLFGDSMLEGLTRRLDDYTEANGYELHTVIWYSSSTEKWATTATLEHYIAQYHPSYFVLCLGSNELFVNDLDQRDQYIKTLIAKMGDKPFVWIGPPNWKEDTGIDQLICDNVGKGAYFDSSKLNLTRGKDGRHPTFSAAAGWGDLIAKWMSSSKCDHPIKMDRPKKNGHAKVELLNPDFPGY